STSAGWRRPASRACASPAPAPRRSTSRPTSTPRAAASRSVWGPRSTRSIRARPRRSPIALAPLQPCSTRWPRWSACCCAIATRCRRDSHQPRHPAVLQRAQRSDDPAARRGARGRVHGLQRLARPALLAQRHAAGHAGVARRSARRRSAAAGGAAARHRRRQADRLRVDRRPRGERPDRSPHVLVDRPVQPVRGDAARRRADYDGAPEHPGPGVRPQDRRHREDSRRHQHVPREPGRDRRVQEHVLSGRAHRRAESAERDAGVRVSARGRTRDRQPARHEAAAMMPLWKRILIEKRAVIIPLAILILANIAAYALWVYPLGVKSAGAVDRAVAAERAVKAAEQDLAAARALVAGKTRAEQELSTFYNSVLPADFASARRLTYATLPALARKANVKLVERRADI